jgi:hypothetical protein
MLIVVRVVKRVLSAVYSEENVRCLSPLLSAVYHP